MKHIFNSLFLILIYTSIIAQTSPDFLGTPIKWTQLAQNETESFLPDDWGSVSANLISPTYTLDLGENILVVYEQLIANGWILMNIQAQTGEVVWKNVVTQTTDSIRSFPAYLYQSSPNTVDLVGSEMISDLQSTYIGYLFRSRISLEDGSIIETFSPTYEEGGTFLWNWNGAMASLAHNSSDNSFFAVEGGIVDSQTTPAGVWRFIQSDSDCLETTPHTYITGNRFLNENEGKYHDRVGGLHYLNGNGYMLLLEEHQIDDWENPINYLEFVKLNEAKEVEWRKDITSEVGTGGNLVLSSSSGYMVYGRWNVGSIPYDSDRPYFVSKFDDEGNFLWRSTIDAANKIHYAASLKTEEGYLLGGVRNEEESFLMKCDEEGNISEIANWKVGGEALNKKIFLNRFLERQNGDIMAMMNVYRDTTITSPFGGTSKNNIGLNFISLIENDDLFTDIEEPITNNLALTLYPNPSQGKVTIVLPKTSKGLLQFYTTHGQLQQTIAVEGKQRLSVPIEGLSDGLYYVHWSGEDGETTVQSLVIHR